ncbi:hypothetical protein COEREDRAFT_89648 [Coemansia reversa NRRL 1564]|uniref:Uncharacterized protein n=1 Tax=Coemansia reversa (strain ATCC 12441 / NRRL 1564) TaxID=763665 RepID=A0A2G5B2W5_COERN|nr:hypothetical protein COEREDRAFT_89648 [Coemansia reversa NRRL 1564]|eukprot:PIA13369.1 hypothetical protein COEREDRAFT_89648 [Coemansia reversa NRRL 1564]
MSKASARDLLRKAREQKKQQLRQSGESNAGRNSLTALATIDPSIYVNNSGTLYCKSCKMQVKPGDAAGWSVHSKTHRHQNNMQRIAATDTSLTAVKRVRDKILEGHTEDVSDNVAAELNIVHNTSDPDSKVNDTTQQPADAKRRKISNLVTYGSDSDSSSENSRNSSKGADNFVSSAPVDNAKTDTTAASVLPSGFFDEGVMRVESSDEEDKHDTDCKTESKFSELNNVHGTLVSSSRNSVALKGKYFTNTEEELSNLDKGGQDNTNGQITGTMEEMVSQKTLVHTTNLEDTLATFEIEISKLAIPDSEQQPNGDTTELPDESGDNSYKEERWNQKTRHLAQLNSIIKEGMQEMDPEEFVDSVSDDSTSDGISSDAEYADFTDWRSYQL